MAAAEVLMEKEYVVYGYYSSSESGWPGHELGRFCNRECAEEEKNDFESVYGRHAWIEVE